MSMWHVIEHGFKAHAEAGFGAHGVVVMKCGLRLSITRPALRSDKRCIVCLRKIRRQQRREGTR